jgi:hypothetical protein
MKKHLSEKKSGFIVIVLCGVVVLITILVFIAAAAFIGDRKGAGADGTLITGENGGVGGCTDGKMSQADLSRIEQNKSVYQQAAKTANIDWEMLAAIHYRESSNSPDRSLMSGEIIGTKNPDNGKTYNTLYDSAVAAAKSLDSNTIKLAFLGHNRGNMYKNGGCDVDQSPYVMNQFDEAHKNMTWPNSKCEPASTRGRTETRPGAFTVYSILKGNISGSGSCGQASVISASGPCGQKIVQIATAEVGAIESPTHSDQGPNNSPTNRGITQYYKKGRVDHAPWCSYFATWVLQNAGERIPTITLASDVYNYYNKKGQAFTKASVLAGKNTPQPGDIFVRNLSGSGHIGIVASYANGMIRTIEGNSDEKVRAGVEYISVNNGDVKGFGRPTCQ